MFVSIRSANADSPHRVGKTMAVATEDLSIAVKPLAPDRSNGQMEWHVEIKGRGVVKKGARAVESSFTAQLTPEEINRLMSYLHEKGILEMGHPTVDGVRRREWRKITEGHWELP